MKRAGRFGLVASIYSDAFGLVPHPSGLKASTHTIDGSFLENYCKLLKAIITALQYPYLWDIPDTTTLK